ncbi:MAG: hypothetical protein GQ574_11970 [Crocinitomix sp.]|nr:hypothetical protein [Crocinitomix sp.]
MGSHGSAVIVNALRQHQGTFPFVDRLQKIALLKAELGKLKEKGKKPSKRAKVLEGKLKASYKKLANEANAKAKGK